MAQLGKHGLELGLLLDIGRVRLCTKMLALLIARAAYMKILKNFKKIRKIRNFTFIV